MVSAEMLLDFALENKVGLRLVISGMSDLTDSALAA